MAEEPKLTVRQFSVSYPFDEPVTFTGTIVYEAWHNGCWAIQTDDPPDFMQLHGLDAEFQREGLRVTLTGHFESNRVGDCIPFLLLFVDQVATE